MGAAALAGPQEEADALLAKRDWPAAAAAYGALLEADAENANNWFSLGQAHHQLMDFAAARDAYRTALDKGYQPAARARFHLARALMSLGDEKTALAVLEDLAKNPANVTHRVIQAAPEFASLAAEPRFIKILDTLKPCNTAAHRAFDFWVGDWEVTQPGGAVSYNKISLVQDGCVVLEEYTNGTFTGMSINFFDPTTGNWHQSWMSNSGGAVYLEGGLDGAGAMAMTDKDLPVSRASGTINRVTWTPNPEGGLRQYWEASNDDGKTWSVVFDGVYTARRD